MLKYIPAFAHRDYRWHAIGRLINNVGTFANGVLVAWLTTRATESVFLVGAATLAYYAPVLFLALYSGALADRHNRKGIQVGCQITAALLNLIFLFVGADGMNIWMLIGYNLLAGCVVSLDSPSREAFWADLLPPEKVLGAAQWERFSENLARFFGSALGWQLLRGGHTAWIIEANIFSFLFCVYAILMTDASGIPTAQRKREGVGGALAYIRSHPLLLTILGMGIALMGFSTAYVALLPQLAKTLDASGKAFSSLIAAFGVGGILAGLIGFLMGKKFSDRAIPYVAAIHPIGILGLACANSTEQAVIASCVAGIGGSLISPLMRAAVQHNSRDDIRGKVLGYHSLSTFGSLPLGLLAISAVGQALGSSRLAVAIFALAAIAILAPLGFYFKKHQRK